MVRELQRRFIKTTMLVVTILLVVFLAVMNIVNFALSRRDSRSTLNRIEVRDAYQLRDPGIPNGNVPALPEEGRGPGVPEAVNDPAVQDVGAGSLGIYFTAAVNEQGEVIYSDLSHASDLTTEDILPLLRSASKGLGIEVTAETEADTEAETEADAGMHGTGTPPAKPDAGENEPPAEGERSRKAKRYDTGRTGNYMYRVTVQEDGCVTYAFLDISQETEAILRILLVTVAVGLGTWFLVLLLVIFLSRRAIAPIAQNIEKQRQFITDAGHELKTPLAVIISNVDVQELHGGKTKWLENIRSQALRLSDLTKQMLTLSKMDESGASTFVSTTFDASQVMQDTVRVFRESASLRGMQISTQIDPDIQITFSKEQYQQMLELLLDNAVKYGKEGGEIFVSMHADRRMVRMKFSNPCEQLPDIEPDRLFDRFYRADTSRSRQTGGSGIGLAVVRAIAEHSGGKAAAYFHPDQVIEFVVEIPVNK